jgi:hypothetical protein
VATLNFGTTDRKVFTPISSALANLPNGAGTVIVLIHKTTTGFADFCGLTNSAGSNWYHGLEYSASSALSDDDGVAFFQSGSLVTDDTTNWYWDAVDWAAGGPSIEQFHTRNHTTGGAWSHSAATANNGGNRAGPGTGGWLRIGYTGDFAIGTKDIALVAIWAGTRFSTSDYAVWSKTSDLYNHPLGSPTFLCEVNATTLVDLIGGSTYSPLDGSGTTLTGSDPPSFTFDGLKPPIIVPTYGLFPKFNMRTGARI